MVSFEFYVNEYHGGTVPESDWVRMEARAQLQMEKWKRSMSFSGEDRQVNLAICALADGLWEADSMGMLRSASIGSVSVEYRVKNPEKMLLERISSFVDVYRGVG